MRLSVYRDAIVQTAIVPRTTLDGFIRLSEQSREVSLVNVGPEAFVASVKPHRGPAQGLVRRARARVRGARAGARGVRGAFGGRARGADAGGSGGREEVLRIQQVALRAARGAPREPHPLRREGGRDRGRAQGRRGEGDGARGRAEEEAGGIRRGREEGFPGPGLRRAGRRPRLLRPRRDGEALRGGRLRREEGRHPGPGEVRFRLPHHPRDGRARPRRARASRRPRPRSRRS